MVHVPGFSLRESVHRGRRTVLYRATRDSDGLPVILKLFPASTSAERARLHHEHAILQLLDGHGAVRALDLLGAGEQPVLVLEDLGGQSLRAWLGEHTPGLPLGLRDVLLLAGKLVAALQEVHGRRIIHKDLNPNNILIVGGTRELATAQIKLIDFGIAATIGREVPTFQNPSVIEGTLPYIAPEQTGRMNRSVDYRADFYALGICLYELLTGTVPFTAADPLAMIHCHLAQSPEPPQQRVPAVPAAVSAVVLKLLAKDAEQRYQSLEGLAFDLARCLVELEATGHIAPFALGQGEQSGRLQLPQRLYGREEDIDRLLSAFERACVAPPAPPSAPASAELLLITGESGTGKSSLVREIHKPITRQRGIFLTGKFDQYQGSTAPYSAFARAFDSLCHYLMTESEEVLAGWREQILQAVGEQGRVITEIVPALEAIIGPQPEQPELDAAGRQNRLVLTFQRFLAAVCRPEHPLVLFLDDLQWADGASLRLLAAILADSSPGKLLVIGAYRDNEVGPGHLLLHVLADLRAAGVAITTLALGSLGVAHVTALLADTLQCSQTRVAELASLVHAKTRGNAFFVHRFLYSLYEDGLLVRAPGRAREESWTWDMAALRARSVTDNVVEFLQKRIERLPAQARAVLELAACLGNAFDLGTLALVADLRTRTSAEPALPAVPDPTADGSQRSNPSGSGHDLLEAGRQTLRQLWPAIEEELLIPSEQAYKVLRARQPEAAELAHCRFFFQHDRVHQAVHAGIALEERTALHLALGRRLLARLPAEVLERRLFEIVDQYNHGLALLDDSEERLRLARLNWQAGIRAKASSAHGPALQYLDKGLAALDGHDGWERAYELCLGLHVEIIEAAYLNGELERMELHAQETLAHARTVLDAVPVHEARIQAYQAQNRLTDAVTLGLEVLAKLGIELPRQPEPERLDAAFQAMRELLGNRSADEIASLPPMTEPHLLAAFRVMTSIASVLWNVAPVLYPFVILRMVELSVRHGNNERSAMFYGTYGLVRCTVANDLDEAHHWALIAREVGRRFDSKRSHGRTMFVVHYFLWHWKHPIQDTVRPFREGYTFSLESGDLEQAAWCLMGQTCAWYCMGRPLPAIRDDLEEHIAILGRIKQRRVEELARIFLQGITYLLAETERPWDIVGEIYDERDQVEGYRRDNNLVALAFLYCNRLINAYLFGNHQRCLEDCKVLDTCIAGTAAMVTTPLVNCYDSLARLALVDSLDEQERASQLERVARNQQRMHEWALHAPMNCQHKYELVEAELARVRGEHWRAIALYQAAIEGASKHGFLREEAVANERASEFWEAHGNPAYARLHGARARQLYEAWGARAKAAALTRGRLHGKLPQAMPETHAEHESGHRSTFDASALDLLSIIKAARAISSEIVLTELRHTMLSILRENAGAQYAALLDFDEHQGWSILGQSGDESRAPADLPASVLHYVRRTGKSLVLADASVQSPHADDEIVRARGLHSVLCCPLLRRDRWHGVLYLENSLTADAFGEARQSVVEILAAQAAVALDNARLYHDLAEQNRALETSRSEITAAKQQLQDIIDNSPAVIYVKDRQGRYITVNRRLEQVAGLSRTAILGKTSQEIYAAANAARFQESDQRVLQTGTSLELEEEMAQRDGVHTFLTLKFPLRAADGSIYALGGISTDITDRKQAERTLQHANEELEQRVTERTEQLRAAQRELVDRARHAGMFEIASSILHNLGNALNGITVSNALLHEHVEELPVSLLGRAVALLDRPREELGTFLTEDERGRHMPRFLLELHRKLVKQQELMLEECASLSKQIEHVTHVVGTQQSYARTRITVSERLLLRDLVEDALRLCAIGGHLSSNIQREYGDEASEVYDRHVVVQILVNLITNAKNAVSELPAHVKPRITLTIHQDERRTVVTVSDNGIGFDESVKRKLFTYGFTTRAGGHGFGLHSAAVSAQSLGGRIEARSEGPGHGASFQLVLPRARTAA